MCSASKSTKEAKSKRCQGPKHLVSTSARPSRPSAFESGPGVDIKMRCIDAQRQVTSHCRHPGPAVSLTTLCKYQQSCPRGRKQAGANSVTDTRATTEYTWSKTTNAAPTATCLRSAFTISPNSSTSTQCQAPPEPRHHNANVP